MLWRARCWTTLAAALLPWSCAGSPERAAGGAPPLQAAQHERLREAERLYRAGDPKFAAMRDELARDPATAYWLTRMLLVDVVRRVDAAASSDDSFLATVTGSQSPIECEALDHLRAMQAAAVPALVADLLERRDDRRRLGVEVLAAMGPGVLPELAPLLEDDDRRLRLRAVQVASLVRGPEAVAVLERGAADAEFTVRAAALRGLVRSGPQAAARLRQAAAGDADPFVRRVAVAELGALAAADSEACRDRETAKVLVDYYADCAERQDVDGMRAADASLRAVSGQSRAADLGYWRAWLLSWSDREGR
jgi:hypothetical protein